MHHSNVLSRYSVLLALTCLTACEGSLQKNADTNEHRGAMNQDTDQWTDADASNDSEGGLTDMDGSQDCVPRDVFFAREVWPEFKAQCASCHNMAGIASQTRMVIDSRAVTPEALEFNRELIADVAKIDAEDGSSLLLYKPMSENDHAGGKILKEGDALTASLRMFVELERTNRMCEPAALVDMWEGVELEDPYATLRRFALLGVARLPTQAEIESVEQGGEEALGEVIAEMMTEPAFASIIAEGFNDVLLTDGVDVQIARLGYSNYNSLFWFDDIYDSSSPERRQALQDVNHGIRRAPSELIKHIVLTRQPMTQLVLADHTMVNPFSARSFGVFEDIEWTDPEDRDEFHVARLGPTQSTNGEPYPHAGVLTDYAYMLRYPSSETNLARGRARAYMKIFLNYDILAEAPLMADPLVIEANWPNPIRDAPECAVCHVSVDSIAGLFRNYTPAGARFYSPSNRPADTFPAGLFISSTDPPTVPVADRVWQHTLPEHEQWRAMRWLAERTVEDERFAAAFVTYTYTLVMGRPPLEVDAKLTGMEREGAFLAQKAQAQDMKAWQELFVEKYDIRVLVKAIVMSPWYRARHADHSTPLLDTARADIGSAQLLTPEHLHRKIVATFGDPFVAFLTSRPLLDSNRMRILYGGIDSTSVNERLLRPNGVMGGIQYLIGNSVGCKQATREFSKPPAQRLLLGGVELSMVGGDDEAAIRATLVSLHERLLGERFTPDHVEIDASYALFTEVQTRGKLAITEQREVKSTLSDQCNTSEITEDPDYVIRAWAAVFNYMIQSYEFLHQ